MSDERPAIPEPLRRSVLVEAGHRCAIPTCQAIPVEVHHIVPWAQVKEHSVDNLITLCPNCHARADKGEIDRPALRAYKANLGMLQSRYGEVERRLFQYFVDNPAQDAYYFVGSYELVLSFAIRDGLIVHMTDWSESHSIGSLPLMETYRLTPAGKVFIAHLREGGSLDGEARD